MRHSETFSTVAKQLIEAKKKFVFAKKSGHNKHLGNHYANLDDVLAAITPALSECGLMALQSTMDKSTPQMMYIETTILHESGEWLSFEYQMPIEGTTAQKYGSTTSYGRRYALCAVFGVSQSDDDAEIAKRTASDFKGIIESCDNIEDLQKVHQNAKNNLDAANWKITEPMLIKRKQELQMGAAKGFPGATKAKVVTEKTQEVAPEPKKAVESQDISSF